MNGRVLILTPEPPYPLHSGGAYRTASLVHYFSRIADVDLILFSESGQPALLPRGLVREQHVISLPRNSRAAAARYARNARRAVLGIPPLIDRLSGFEHEIAGVVQNQRYDIGVIEHFWCAPYVTQLSGFCETTVLDLHNVESILHSRCAATSGLTQRAGHHRFARASRRMEAELLPLFNLVLTTSETDSGTVKQIAPRAHTAVYPNALPTVPAPRVSEDVKLAVFSGNLEYHPNIDAVQFLAREIWPLIRREISSARLRLVGKGDAFVRSCVAPGLGMEMTGPVESALHEIARGELVVVPLRTGSGTRIKILEAWAAGKAVVATPLAAEGLEATHNGNIFLAATPVEFAAAVVRLMGDPDERHRIGAAGRRTFEQHYTWQAAWRTMDIHLKTLYPSGLGGYTE